MSEQPKIGVLCNSTLGIPSLHALLSSKLIAALAVPDKEHDATSDIKNMASSYNCAVNIFEKKGFKTSISNWIKENKLDVVFVFTFPWKIDTAVLNLPRLGFINFHFGLLPQYRGADAIFWPIKNRAAYGGISVHQMDANFDTGALFHVEKVPLLPADTYGMYAAKLANANVHVLQKILPHIFSGQAKTTAQNIEDAHYYNKPTIKDIAIQWDTMTTEEIVALINACNPWNKGAYTMLNNMPLRITEAKVKEGLGNNNDSGVLVDVNEKGLHIQCINNKVLIATVVTIEEGIYSANSFALYCGIQKGLKFSNL